MKLFSKFIARVRLEPGKVRAKFIATIFEPAKVLGSNMTGPFFFKHELFHFKTMSAYCLSVCFVGLVTTS